MKELLKIINYVGEDFLMIIMLIYQFRLLCFFMSLNMVMFYLIYYTHKFSLISLLFLQFVYFIVLILSTSNEFLFLALSYIS